MENLSHLAKNSIVAGSSMAGGNTISGKPYGSLEASESECTADVDTHNTPDLDEGTPTDKYTHNPAKVGYTPTPLTWKTVK